MPARRTTDNSWYKYIPWAVVLALVSVAVVAGETRMRVQANAENVGAIMARQDKLRDALREQAAVNGRIDERTQTIQRQLSVVIQSLRER